MRLPTLRVHLTLEHALGCLRAVSVCCLLLVYSFLASSEQTETTSEPSTESVDPQTVQQSLALDSSRLLLHLLRGAGILYATKCWYSGTD